MKHKIDKINGKTIVTGLPKEELLNSLTNNEIALIKEEGGGLTIQDKYKVYTNSNTEGGGDIFGSITISSTSSPSSLTSLEGNVYLLKIVHINTDIPSVIDDPDEGDEELEIIVCNIYVRAIANIEHTLSSSEKEYVHLNSIQYPLPSNSYNILTTPAILTFASYNSVLTNGGFSVLLEVGAESGVGYMANIIITNFDEL